MKAEIKTLECRGFRMDYAVFGNGPRPLVIIPGMSVTPVTPSAGAVAASFRCFNERYTAFLFDRVSDMPDGYSVEDMARDTAEAMQALGLKDACVFGASQGAMIAMVIAIRHPELVAALALASTLSRPNDVSRETFATWMELVRKGDPVPLNRDVFSRVYSPAFMERFGKALAQFEGNGTAEDIRRFGIEAEASVNFDIYDKLDGIKCPVFIAGVENDSAAGGIGTLEIADRLGVKPLIYPGSGHAAYDEDKDFPGKLFDFFEKN